MRKGEFFAKEFFRTLARRAKRVRKGEFFAETVFRRRDCCPAETVVNSEFFAKMFFRT